MRLFDAYQALTDVEKFGRAMFGLVHNKCQTAEELIEILKEELPKETQQLMRTAVEEINYPLSLERLNKEVDVVNMIPKYVFKSEEVVAAIRENRRYRYEQH